jgi:hypothetical protein
MIRQYAMKSLLMAKGALDAACLNTTQVIGWMDTVHKGESPNSADYKDLENIRPVFWIMGRTSYYGACSPTTTGGR